MKAKKVTKHVLQNIFQDQFCVDYIQAKRNDKGVFRFMRGYFYRTTDNGPAALKAHVANTLRQYFPIEMETGTIEIETTGDAWKPFKGGAPVPHNSHYWVDVRLPINLTIDTSKLN